MQGGFASTPVVADPSSNLLMGMSGVLFGTPETALHEIRDDVAEPSVNGCTVNKILLAYII